MFYAPMWLKNVITTHSVNSILVIILLISSGLINLKKGK